jgi:hypothetical protein
MMMVRLRLLSGLALVAAAAPFASVQAQDSMSDSARLKLMAECDAIQSESVRLSCYDGAIRRGRSALGNDRAGMLPGTVAAQPRTPAQAFGMTPKLERSAGAGVPAKPAPVEEISARVTSASDIGVGIWRIAFADGTRWQFTEGQMQFQPPAAGDEVRIRKGALGGYLLYAGGQPSVRVMRVR